MELRLELRFFLPHFLIGILQFNGVGLNHLTLSALKFVIFLMFFCSLFLIQPTKKLFHFFYVSKLTSANKSQIYFVTRLGILQFSYPSDHKEWRGEFVFVNIPRITSQGDFFTIEPENQMSGIELSNQDRVFRCQEAIQLSAF